MQAIKKVLYEFKNLLDSYRVWLRSVKQVGCVEWDEHAIVLCIWLPFIANTNENIKNGSYTAVSCGLVLIKFIIVDLCIHLDLADW